MALSQDEINGQVGVLYAKAADFIYNNIRTTDTFGQMSGELQAALTDVSRKMQAEIAKIECTRLQKIKALNTVNAEMALHVVTDPRSPYAGKMSADQFNRLALQSVLGGPKEYIAFGNEINGTLEKLILREKFSKDLYDNLMGCYTVLQGNEPSSNLSLSRENAPNLNLLATLSLKAMDDIDRSTQQLGNLESQLADQIACLVEFSKPYFNIQYDVLEEAGYTLSPRSNAAFLIPFIPALKTAIYTALAYAGGLAIIDLSEKKEQAATRSVSLEETERNTFCEEVNEALKVLYSTLSTLISGFSNAGGSAATLLKALVSLKNSEAYKNILDIQSREYILYSKVGVFQSTTEPDVRVRYTYGKDCITGQLKEADMALNAFVGIPSTESEVDGLTPAQQKEKVISLGSLVGASVDFYKKAAENAKERAAKAYEKSGLADAARRRRAFTNLIEYGSYAAVGLGVIWGLSKIYKGYVSED